MDQYIYYSYLADQSHPEFIAVGLPMVYHGPEGRPYSENTVDLPVPQGTTPYRPELMGWLGNTDFQPHPPKNLSYLYMSSGTMSPSL